MARVPTTWQGFRRALWALTYDLVAKPLSRLGDQLHNLGLWCFCVLDRLDDHTKDLKQYVHNKAWPK
ncbi:MAG: hypothetical protein ACXABY_02870 [Candidatus Thorarchaeota archaeon]|jgi:hypothetical protein